MGTMLKMTAEEYLAMPYDGKLYQLIEGELVMSPSPNFWHQEFLTRLLTEMRVFTQKKKLGQTIVAPLDVKLDEANVYQPDIAFVSNSRKSIIRDSGLFGATDLCVEVLSPSNRKYDLNAKRATYARCGVLEYWIVDPDAKTVSVYRLQDDATQPVAVFTEAGTLVSPLLPGFEFSVAALFARGDI